MSLGKRGVYALCIKYCSVLKKWAVLNSIMLALGYVPAFAQEPVEVDVTDWQEFLSALDNENVKKINLVGNVLYQRNTNPVSRELVLDGWYFGKSLKGTVGERSYQGLSVVPGGRMRFANVRMVNFANVQSGDAAGGAISNGGTIESISDDFGYLFGDSILANIIDNATGSSIGGGIRGDSISVGGGETMSIYGSTFSSSIGGGRGDDTISIGGGILRSSIGGSDGDDSIILDIFVPNTTISSGENDTLMLSLAVSRSGEDAITGDVTGTTFLGNRAESANGDACGGAIHNAAGGEIGTIAAGFKNNSVKADNGCAKGGAISNAGSIESIAGLPVGSGSLLANIISNASRVGVGNGGVVFNNSSSDGYVGETMSVYGGMSNATIGGGDGGDTISIRGGIPRSSIGGGDGNDIISIGGGIPRSSIDGGDGDDTISIRGGIPRSSIGGGDGGDTISIGGGIPRSSIGGGDGDDTISIGGGIPRSSIGGGNGDDTIPIGGVSDGSIGGGDGGDTISIRGGASDGSILGGNMANFGMSNSSYRNADDAILGDIVVVTFHGNGAESANGDACGGAIYNEGTLGIDGSNAPVVFSNNYANAPSGQALGGAIYNSGEMTLQGRVIFSGNRANGELNDIHNIGNLDIIEGNITLDGGITGQGTISFSGDNRLYSGNLLNKTIIQAGTLQLDGDVLLPGDSLNVANGTGHLENVFAQAENWAGTGVFALEAGYKNRLYDIEVNQGTIIVNKRSEEKIISNLTREGVDAQQARAIKAFSDSAGDNPVLQTITGLAQNGDAGRAGRLTEEISPTTSRIVMGIAQDTDRILGNIVHGRMDIDTTRAQGSDVWAQGLAVYSKDNNSSGSSFSAHIRGFAMGMDGKVNEKLLVGVGYARTGIDGESGQRDFSITGNNFFTYAKYKPSNWYVGGMLNFGLADYSESKIFGLGDGYGVRTLGVNVMAGYDLPKGITPEFGLRYLTVERESSADAIQSIGGYKSHVFTGIMGVRYKAARSEGDWTYRMNLRLAGTWDMGRNGDGSDVNVIGGGRYRIKVEPLSRFGVETGIGLEASRGNWNFSLDYNGGFRKGFRSHAGMLRIEYTF